MAKFCIDCTVDNDKTKNDLTVLRNTLNMLLCVQGVVTNFRVTTSWTYSICSLYELDISILSPASYDI